MTWRRAIAYWLCFAVLLAVDRFVVRTGDLADAAPQRAPLASVATGDVRALEVERGGKRLRAEKVGERWQVTSPHAEVPSDLVSAVVESLTTLPDVEVVADATARLTDYGLDPAETKLALEPRVGPPLRLRFGARNPAGTAVYAQRGDDPHVLLVGLNTAYYVDLLLAAVP